MISQIRLPRNYTVTLSALAALITVMLIVCIAVQDYAMLKAGLLVAVILAVVAWYVRSGAKIIAAQTNSDNRQEAIKASVISQLNVADSTDKELKDTINLSPAENIKDTTGMDSFISDLSEIGAEYKQDSESSVVFKYQGGFFQANSLGDNLIRITYPRIFSSPVSKQDFICRVLNNINSSYAVCKLVASSTDSDSKISVHGFADMYYGAKSADKIALLKDIFAVFFEQQRSLLVSSAIADADLLAVGLPLAEEMTTAYKDISLN